jgi:hypothetical protein
MNKKLPKSVNSDTNLSAQNSLVSRILDALCATSISSKISILLLQNREEMLTKSNQYRWRNPIGRAQIDHANNKTGDNRDRPEINNRAQADRKGGLDRAAWRFGRKESEAMQVLLAYGERD